MWVFLSSINDKNAVILQHFLLQMLIKPQEGGNEEEICHDPRHRVAEADTRPSQGWHQPETHTASRYHFHYATQHREIAVTQALDAVAQDGEQAQTRIEIVGYAHKLGSISYHFRLALIHEEHHHLVGKRIDEQEGEDEINQHHPDGSPYALTDSIQLPGSQVLTAIGSHCHSDVLENAGKEIFDAHRGSKCSHINRSQSVVRTLQHDEADGGNGELQTHRNTIVQQNADLLVVEFPFLTLRNQNLHFLLDKPDTEQHGNSLRKPSSDARTLYAQSHAENQNAIENDVDDRGGDEEIERLFRVAQGTNLTGEQIVAYGERNRRKLQHQEDVGVIEDLCWRIHQVQNLSAEDAGKKGNNHGKYHGDADAVAHVSPHLGIIPGTESLGDRDGKTGTGAVAETHDEKHDGAGCAYCRKSPHANPSSHDGGIDDEIHLLKDVA